MTADAGYPGSLFVSEAVDRALEVFARVEPGTELRVDLRVLDSDWLRESIESIVPAARSAGE